jgi:hypothetical protein
LSVGRTHLAQTDPGDQVLEPVAMRGYDDDGQVVLDPDAEVAA